jgi:hypothetical protein
MVMGMLLYALIPASGWAECGCFCVEGRLQTLCSNLQGAAAGTDSCAARAADECPVDLREFDRQHYAPPVEGAANCRDVRLWDATRQTHASVKVCDLAQPG